jgi:hypothetical protein
MKPGIHSITIDQYHGGPGVSRSGIMQFMKSPLHYWHEYLNPEKEPREKPQIITTANALEFGNAFHSYVLESSEFDKRYMVFDKQDGRTSAGKAANAQAAFLQGDRELIDSKAFTQITKMARSINSQPTAKGMIDGARYEQSLFWSDPDTGILCKVRPDIWHNNFIVDLKTARSAAPGDFQRDLFGFGYHLQAAMISEAIWHLQGVNMMQFTYVVVEKDAPYATAVYKLEENAINHGREQFKKILFELKDCIVSDTWRSYPDSILDLPSWAYNNKEEI